MANPRTVQRIGVFGHVGNKNLGDEALFAAVVQNVRRRYPDVKICGYSINPHDTQERHKIPAFPIRRIERNPRQAKQHLNVGTSHEQSNLVARIKLGLKKIPPIYGVLKGIQKCLRAALNSPNELKFLVQCTRNLRGTDLLIVAGSQQLSDYFGGAWGSPYTLFKWSVIAKLVGTKVAFLSVGVGPINSPLSRFFIRHSLRLASYCSYRDEGSKWLIEKLGVSGENPVFPDLVFSLEITEPLPLAESQSPPLVAINPLPFFDDAYWPEHSTDVYEGYLRKLAAFALWLIQRGYRVSFVPTQLLADPPVIREIRRLMNNEGGPNVEAHLVDRPVLTFEDLISEISKTDIVVATRFHGIILSHLLKKSVLGIAYHKKSSELMAQMGQSEYVVDINRLDLNVLRERFILLESRGRTAEAEIEQRVSLYRRVLEDQYDRVFRLLEENHT